jgi:hypothetical protein
MIRHGESITSVHHFERVGIGVLFRRGYVFFVMFIILASLRVAWLQLLSIYNTLILVWIIHVALQCFNIRDLGE